MSPFQQPGAVAESCETPPTLKTWKHLDDPTAPQWLRGLRDSIPFPNLADFVVLSIDPVASVGHLDRFAREAASLLPIRKYVALAYSSSGLPIETKATHPYDFVFVRKGLPEPRLHGFDSPASCIAVLPNTHIVGPSRDPVRPAQPLPWDDCYLDATYGFPFPCRVASIDRDYTAVLPMLNTELVRLRRCLQPHWASVSVSECEPLELVEATPLMTPPSKDARSASRTDEASPVHVEHTDGRIVEDSDHVSIIGSDDGSEHGSVSDGDSADEEELEMLLNFEHMMFNAGDVHDPVVNTWYDLDMVTEIVDPVHFLEDVKRLNMIVDEAEIRLGLRPRPEAANSSTESAGRPDSVTTDQPEKAAEHSAATPPPKAIPKMPSLPAASLTARVRAYLRSLAAKCSAYVQALAHRFIPRRRKKVAQSKVKTS